MSDALPVKKQPSILPQPTLKQPAAPKKTGIDNNIASAISDDSISVDDKIIFLKDQISLENAKLRGLSQRAAQDNCLQRIEQLRQQLSILSAGHDFVDEDGDLDVFDAITYSAIQVANKTSNSFVLTGDAGVGKTMTVLVAIAFLKTRGVKQEDIDTLLEEFMKIEDDEAKSLEEAEEEPTEIKETPVPGSVAKVIGVAKNQPVPKTKKAVDPSNSDTNCGYVIQSGTCTTAALYEHLWIHRDKLHIFNDFDSVLKDAESVNLLKAALDTYPVRELSKMTKGNSFNSYGMSDKAMWDEYEMTGKVPNTFKFTGQIIFISNIHEDKFDTAIISRSLHVDVRLSKAETIARMYKLMLDIMPEVSIEYKQEALFHLEHIVENYTCKFKLNLRQLIHAINCKRENPDLVVKNKQGKDVYVWKQLVKRNMIKSKLVN
jgi:hypothetical protein